MHLIRSIGQVVKRTERRLKMEQCEHCSASFGYTMERQATGSALSLWLIAEEEAQDVASERAARKLERKFERGTDLVCCPTCGYYQAAMIRDRKRRLLVYGVLISLAPAAVYFGMLSFDPTMATAGILARVVSSFGIAGIVISVIVIALLNLNSQAGRRANERIGRRGIPAEELTKQTHAAKARVLDLRNAGLVGAEALIEVMMTADERANVDKDAAANKRYAAKVLGPRGGRGRVDPQGE